MKENYVIYQNTTTFIDIQLDSFYNNYNRHNDQFDYPNITSTTTHVAATTINTALNNNSIFIGNNFENIINGGNGSGVGGVTGIRTAGVGGSIGIGIGIGISDVSSGSATATSVAAAIHHHHHHHHNQHNGSSGVVGVNGSLLIDDDVFKSDNNYWALLAFVLVFGTAAGNILVCLAIAWERRLQNVTNYFLMSLAITDLMVAILVMPLGILTLVKGYFPFESEHCLAWICLDVLFCTASIMHLCTISVDRYLSLKYPMRFGRNKTRKRVTIKIIFVWILSIAMSLPLSLMYSKNHSSVLVNGTCQIPDPVYKLVGSIICFYIPLLVMLITYCSTVRLLAHQQQHLGIDQRSSKGWTGCWLGGKSSAGLERRCTWQRLLKTSLVSTPSHAHSANSTETELPNFDSRELWLPESSIPDPKHSTITALHQLGSEMLKLSCELESVTTTTTSKHQEQQQKQSSIDEKLSTTVSTSITTTTSTTTPLRKPKRSNSHTEWTQYSEIVSNNNNNNSEEHIPLMRKRFNSLPRDIYEFSGENMNGKKENSIVTTISTHCDHQIKLTRNNNTFDNLTIKFDTSNIQPISNSRSFLSTNSSAQDKPINNSLSISDNASVSVLHKPPPSPSPSKELVKILNTTTATAATNSSTSPSIRKLSYSKTNSVVTWDSKQNLRRGSSFGGVRTSLLLSASTSPLQSTSNAQQITVSPFRRSATLRNHHHHNINICDNNTLNIKSTNSGNSPNSFPLRNATIRSHHSRNSSVISRNSSRHGRIIRLEQKATKVLGVVFFTFVILWAPFFVLNLLPSICGSCEANLSHWVFDTVTWLGYASSMVNPIFYTIFNKVFRQAFKNVLLCNYTR